MSVVLERSLILQESGSIFLWPFSSCIINLVYHPGNFNLSNKLFSSFFAANKVNCLYHICTSAFVQGRQGAKHGGYLVSSSQQPYGMSLDERWVTNLGSIREFHS